MVAVVQDMIDAPLPILANIHQILEECLKNGLAYRTILSAVDVLVHPSNRCKLGLNAYNCHHNGANMVKVGADRKELHNAFAIELARQPKEREAQVAFNQQLVDAANGLLAQVTGNERVASVGCGHMAAFTKAAIIGTRTSEASLQDVNGNLALASFIASDSELQAMIKEGWEWTVFKAECEEMWPMLPDLLQRGLNATNTLSADPSELEVASSIAEFMELGGGKVSWQECTEAAIAGNPTCAPYAAKLAKICEAYGGGAGSPIIKND